MTTARCTTAPNQEDPRVLYDAPTGRDIPVRARSADQAYGRAARVTICPPQAANSGRLTRWICTAAYLFIAGAPTPSGSQQPVILKDPSACGKCRLTVTPVAMLGRSGDPNAPSAVSYAATFSGRSFFVAEPVERGQVLVYDAAGRFQRTVGRSGHGPGEFIDVDAMLVDAHDTLHVFGESHSVFAPNGRFVRGQTVLNKTQIFGAAIVPDGKLLLQAMTRSAELVGLPFHIVNRDASVVRSFGSQPGVPYRDSFLNRVRWLSPISDGRFWAALLSKYRIERWSLDGKQDRVFERESPWIDPSTVGRDYRSPRIERPIAAIQSITLDVKGRLWVLVAVADEHWKQSSTESARKEGAVIGPRERRRLFDTIVDVIDTNNGALMLSRRLDQAFERFISPGLVIEKVESDDGEISIQVSRLRLLEP